MPDEIRDEIRDELSRSHTLPNTNVGWATRVLIVAVVMFLGAAFLAMQATINLRDSIESSSRARAAYEVTARNRGCLILKVQHLPAQDLASAGCLP